MNSSIYSRAFEIVLVCCWFHWIFRGVPSKKVTRCWNLVEWVLRQALIFPSQWTKSHFFTLWYFNTCSCLRLPKRFCQLWTKSCNVYKNLWDIIKKRYCSVRDSINVRISPDDNAKYNEQARRCKRPRNQKKKQDNVGRLSEMEGQRKQGHDNFLPRGKIWKLEFWTSHQLETSCWEIRGRERFKLSWEDFHCRKNCIGNKSLVCPQNCTKLQHVAIPFSCGV